MWGCVLMSGVKILHFLKDWWKSIPIHQNYTMALRHAHMGECMITVVRPSQVTRAILHTYLKVPNSHQSLVVPWCTP